METREIEMLMSGLTISEYLASKFPNQPSTAGVQNAEAQNEKNIIDASKCDETMEHSQIETVMPTASHSDNSITSPPNTNATNDALISNNNTVDSQSYSESYSFNTRPLIENTTNETSTSDNITDRPLDFEHSSTPNTYTTNEASTSDNFTVCWQPAFDSDSSNTVNINTTNETYTSNNTTVNSLPSFEPDSSVTNTFNSNNTNEASTSVNVTVNSQLVLESNSSNSVDVNTRVETCTSANFAISRKDANEACCSYKSPVSHKSNNEESKAAFKHLIREKKKLHIILPVDINDEHMKWYSTIVDRWKNSDSYPPPATCHNGPDGATAYGIYEYYNQQTGDEGSDDDSHSEDSVMDVDNPDPNCPAPIMITSGTHKAFIHVILSKKPNNRGYKTSFIYPHPKDLMEN